MTFQKIINQPLLSLSIVVLTVIACVLFWLNSSNTTLLMAGNEQGFIQGTTNILYAASIVFSALCCYRNQRIWPVVVILVLFLCREMDLHKFYDNRSFLKIHSYQDADVPMHFKIVGGMILAALAVFILYLLRYARSMAKALCARKIWAFTAFVLIATLVLAKNLDGLNRNLAIFNLHVDGVFPTLLEEGLELIVPGLISLAIGQFLLENHSKPKEAESD